MPAVTLGECFKGAVDAGNGAGTVAAVEIELFEAHGAQIEGVGFGDSAVTDEGEFGGTAPDVDGDGVTGREKVGAGDASEVGFPGAVDHLDVDAEFPADPFDELRAVGSVANRGGGDTEGFPDAVGVGDGGKVAKRADGALHGGFLQVTAVLVGRLADADAALDFVEQMKRKAAGPLEKHHPHRVRPDVDDGGAFGHDYSSSISCLCLKRSSAIVSTLSLSSSMQSTGQTAIHAGSS